MLRWALAVKAAPDKAAQAADKAAQAANDAKQAAKKAALAIDNYLLSAVPAIPVAPRSAPLDPLLLEVLELIVVDVSTVPCFDEEPPSLECPPVFPDDGVVEETKQFQEDVLQEHGLLWKNRFPQAKFPGQTMQPLRYVMAESALGSIFETEILARAFKILEAVRPFATAIVVRGDEAGHEGMYIVVAVNAVDKTIRESAVLVKLKLPQGEDVVKSVPVCEDDTNVFNVVASQAEMFSAEFAEGVIGQAHAGARDTTKACLPDVKRWLNVDYAFVSTFNDLWVLRFEKDPTERRDASTAEARSSEMDARKHHDSASRVFVSPRFCADARSPHIAFVVANTLARVVDAIYNNPEAYARQDAVRVATHGDFVIPLPRDKRKQGPTATRDTRRTTTNPKGKASAPPPAASGNADKAAMDVSVVEPGSSVTVLPDSPVRSQFFASESGGSGYGGSGYGGAWDGGIRASKIWHTKAGGWDWLSGQITIGGHLGDGRSGVVCAGSVDGSPVALKISDARARAMVCDEMHQEVRVYEYLADLQGVVIPRLLGQGLLELDGTVRAVLVLEQLDDVMADVTSEDNRAKNCPLAARMNALAALAQIHRRGVAHGDPRMYNIVFEADNTRAQFCLKPRFLDLAFAEIGASEQDLAKDLEDWRKVLHLPASAK
ncbi:hypothetical protein GGF43_000629 [Coemansia sp. RSA 2618]|nr:hypothetical protein GGF43_000629 [Coemansia sp. RSA 2618]